MFVIFGDYWGHFLNKYIFNHPLICINKWEKKCFCDWVALAFSFLVLRLFQGRFTKQVCHRSLMSSQTHELASRSISRRDENHGITADAAALREAVSVTQDSVFTLTQLGRMSFASNGTRRYSDQTRAMSILVLWNFSWSFKWSLPTNVSCFKGCRADRRPSSNGNTDVELSSRPANTPLQLVC